MAKILSSILCLLFLAVALAAQQATPSPVPPAPVPSQILAAKKVFISNVPGEIFYHPHSAEDAPYRPYNQFYASLKTWGYFELVSAPADADLILEISLSGRPAVNSATIQAPVHEVHLDLTVRDPKTQVVLWWITERLEGATRVATGEKNYNQAMTNLVDDLKKLVGQPIALAGDPKK